MEEPLFSIVTITYQNLDGLRGTVESVAAQTLTDYEHIVIDGGSTDGSADWLEANFTGAWVSEPDGGRYPAMNKGAAMATGRYLWFLHAGDSLGDPDVLKRVAHLIENGTGGAPEWLFGFARVVAPDRSVVGILGFAPFTMFKFAVQGLEIPHQATVMTRRLFEEIGGYDDRNEVAADQVLLMAAANRSLPLAVADFFCDFDATGLSADRPWVDYLRDGVTVVRQARYPVTRSRTTDLILLVAILSAKQVAALVRNGLMGSG